MNQRNHSNAQRRGPSLRRIACALAALLMVCLGANADTEPALDVVLVLDSSGSMKKTDPKYLRKPAAKLFVSLLGAADRISVVSFSDRGYPIIPLTPLASDADRRRLFGAVDKISSKGALTNLHDAVAQAQRILQGDAQGQRRRLIILMSDGQMDLGDAATSAAHTERLLQEQLPALQAAAIELHTIAFTDQSDQALLERIAQASGGRFYLAQSDAELHEVFAALFEQNKAPDMLPFQGEEFRIDGAVNEVTVIGSKDDPEVALSLITPSGMRLKADDKPSNTKWLVSPRFDLITIATPEPGTWKLQASSGNNRAYIITDLKLKVGPSSAAPALGEQIAIGAWLEENGTALSRPEVLASLQVSLTSEPPGGQHTTQPLTPVSDAGPAGRYAVPFTLDRPGRYTLRVRAETPTFQRERSLVFDIRKPPEGSAAPPAKAEPQPAPAAEKKTKVPAKHAEAAADQHPAKEPAAAPTDAAAAAPAEAQPHAESDSSGVIEALLIFLLLNGTIAALGAGGYAALRWRNKRLAAAPAAEG